jgi:hypothetical protein
LAADTLLAQTQPRYVQLETDDAFIYMDDGGVAVRAEKNFACRNVGWASTADPKVLSNAAFVAFRQGQIDRATWDQWLCKAVVGPVVFSRGILEAQRKMNMAPDKPDCVSWVPETGRLNWEALDYARCYLSKEVQRARADYKDRTAAALAAGLDEGTAEYEVLVTKSKKALLPFAVDGCERTLEKVYDVVACRMEPEGRFIERAEGFFAGYAGRIDRLRGTDPIPQTSASGIAEDAKLIREQLYEARREADGL